MTSLFAHCVAEFWINNVISIISSLIRPLILLYYILDLLEAHTYGLT